MSLECDKKKLKLLKIEVPDRYVQENFKRIEQFQNDVICRDLDTLDKKPSGTVNEGDTIVNINGAWDKELELIPANSTKVIDTLALNSFHSMDHIFSFFNDNEAKTKRIQMTSVREGATINTNVFGRSGSLLNVQVCTIVNGTDAEVEVVNNNNFDISVSYARLTL